MLGQATLVPLAAAGLGLALAPRSMSGLTLYRQTLLTCVLGVGLSRCAPAFCAALRHVHDGIRDEQYLVGLELQDYHRPRGRRGALGPRPASNAPASPASTAAQAAQAAASQAASSTAAAAAAAGTGL